MTEPRALGTTSTGSARPDLHTRCTRAQRTRAGVPGSLKLALLLATAIAQGCGQETERFGAEPTTRVDSPFPCEVQGYPCTWDDVPEETVEQTKRLGEMAALLSVTTPSLDSIVEFLAERAGVVEATIDGTGVRYRLQGGRPAWVFLPSEMDHHRAAPGSMPQSVGLSPLSRTMDLEVPATRPSGDGRAVGAPWGPLGRWLGLRPVHAAEAGSDSPGQADSEAIAGEPGSGKKALILSPYEYEFPGAGSVFASSARLVRDYTEREGGSVVFHADLDAFNDNPAEPGQNYRTVGGLPTLSGEVVFEDFLKWDEYNLIVLAAHGGAMECSRRSPVGGEASQEGGRSRPSPGRGGLCPLIYAGRAKQQSYGQYFGVEIYYAMGTVDRPYQPPDQTTRFDTPGDREWRQQIGTGLTGAEVRECAALVEAGEAEPSTSGGTRCLFPKWEHDKPMLVLWWPFFRVQYVNGLENAIVFLASCHSAKQSVLLEILAPEGNEAITVFGFDTTVLAIRAWAIISKMLELLDKGYDSIEMMKRLKEFDLGLGTAEGMNARGGLRGRVLAPEDEVLPDVPAQLVDETPVATHGRDIVLLVDPGTGKELVDGSTVLVRSTVGEPDRLQVHPQIIGVADDDEPAAFPLQVRVVDEPIPNEFYVADREIEEGAYRYEDDVLLGRDHAEDGEVLDLEVRVELPGGGLSRWVYEDIRLGSCHVPPQGELEGTLSGDRTQVIEAGNERAFAKILGSPMGGWVLQMEGLGKDGRDLTLLFSLDGPPEAGTVVQLESNWMESRVGGNIESLDPDRRVSFNAGTVEISFDVVRPHPRTRKKGFTWVCGTVKAQLTGFEPAGPRTRATWPDGVRGTFDGRFRAEWLQNM